MAHLLRARPGPHPARRGLPPPRRQDPGLRLPGRPPAHPAHPRARGGPGRPGVARPSGSTSRSPRPSPSATTAATGPAATPARTPSAPTSPEGYDHAVWGADVVLAPLNLCAETLDGVRNHSWSRPAPATPEGEVVSWADRIAYVCHDFEDAVLGRHRRRRRCCPASVARAVRDAAQPPARRVHRRHGRRRGGHRRQVGMTAPAGRGAGRVPAVQLRAHLPPAGLGGPGPRPSIAVLQALVEHFADRPNLLPADRQDGVEAGQRRGAAGRGHLRRRHDRPLRLRPGRRAPRLGPGQAAPRGRHPAERGLALTLPGSAETRG